MPSAVLVIATWIIALLVATPCSADRFIPLPGLPLRQSALSCGGDSTMLAPPGYLPSNTSAVAGMVTLSASISQLGRQVGITFGADPPSPFAVSLQRMTPGASLVSSSTFVIFTYSAAQSLNVSASCDAGVTSVTIALQTLGIFMDDPTMFGLHLAYDELVPVRSSATTTAFTKGLPIAGYALPTFSLWPDDLPLPWTLSEDGISAYAQIVSASAPGYPVTVSGIVPQDALQFYAISNNSASPLADPVLTGVFGDGGGEFVPLGHSLLLVDLADNNPLCPIGQLSPTPQQCLLTDPTLANASALWVAITAKSNGQSVPTSCYLAQLLAAGEFRTIMRWPSDVTTTLETLVQVSNQSLRLAAMDCGGPVALQIAVIAVAPSTPIPATGPPDTTSPGTTPPPAPTALAYRDLGFFPLALPTRISSATVPCGAPNKVSVSGLPSAAEALLVVVSLQAAAGLVDSIVTVTTNGSGYTPYVVALEPSSSLRVRSNMVIIRLAPDQSFQISDIASGSECSTTATIDLFGYFAPSTVGGTTLGSEHGYRWTSLWTIATSFVVSPISFSISPRTAAAAVWASMQVQNPPGTVATALVTDAPSVSVAPTCNSVATTVDTTSGGTHGFISKTLPTASAAPTVNVFSQNAALTNSALRGLFDTCGLTFHLVAPYRLLDSLQALGPDATYLDPGGAYRITGSAPGIPDWASSLIVYANVYSTSAHVTGSVTVRYGAAPIPSLYYTDRTFSMDMLEIPIDPVTGYIYVQTTSTDVSLILDLIGYTGIEPPPPPSGGPYSNLAYIPLPAFTRLVDGWGQPTVQAWNTVASVYPNTPTVISVLDVQRAVGSLPGTPLAMHCVVSLRLPLGAGLVQAYLWDGLLAPWPATEPPTLTCVTNCSAAVTVRLNSGAGAASFGITVTGPAYVGVTIDVTGFYYDSSVSGGLLWNPILAPLPQPGSFPTPGVQQFPLSPAGWSAVAATFIGSISPIGSDSEYRMTLWSEPIGLAPPFVPTNAFSAYTSAPAAISGIATLFDSAFVTASVPTGGLSMTYTNTGYFSALYGHSFSILSAPQLLIGNAPPFVTTGNFTAANTGSYPISQSFPAIPFAASYLLAVISLTTQVAVDFQATGTDGVSRSVFSVPSASSPALSCGEMILPLVNGTLHFSMTLSPASFTLSAIGFYTLAIPIPTTPPPTTSAPPPATTAPLSTTTAPPSTTTAPPSTTTVTPPATTAPPTPAQTTRAPLPPLPPPPSPTPSYGLCNGPTPVPGAICVGGAWWLPSLNLTGTVNITNEPVVIGTTLVLGPGSVTVVTPTLNSTLFFVVTGTAHIDGTLIVDLSGRNYTATYTNVAVVRAGYVEGGYSTIKVGNEPKGCATYSAWTAQSATTLNAVLLRDDSNCKSGGNGVGRWGPIAGGVVFGVVILLIAVILVLIKTGVLTPSSYVMLARSQDQNQL